MLRRKHKIPYAQESTILAVGKSVASYETEQEIVMEYRELLRRMEDDRLRGYTGKTE